MAARLRYQRGVFPRRGHILGSAGKGIRSLVQLALAYPSRASPLRSAVGWAGLNAGLLAAECHGEPPVCPTIGEWVGEWVDYGCPSSSGRLACHWRASPSLSAHGAPTSLLPASDNSCATS